MTVDQAYRILGVRPGANQAEIEHAYAAARRTLQLQLVPGTPLAVREKAQAPMAELRAAFELVKAARPPARSSRPARSRRPKMQPAAGQSGQPRTTAPVVRRVVFTISHPVFVAGAVLAGIGVLLAVLFPLRPAVRGTHETTAQLRVLSVPWSYVEVNETPLGPSGQANAFVLQPGRYKLVLHQSGRTLTRTISLPDNCETIVKAQLEKGQVDVTHRQIQLASP